MIIIQIGLGIVLGFILISMLTSRDGLKVLGVGLGILMSLAIVIVCLLVLFWFLSSSAKPKTSPKYVTEKYPNIISINLAKHFKENELELKSNTKSCSTIFRVKAYENADPTELTVFYDSITSDVSKQFWSINLINRIKIFGTDLSLQNDWDSLYMNNLKYESEGSFRAYFHNKETKVLYMSKDYVAVRHYENFWSGGSHDISNDDYIVYNISDSLKISKLPDILAPSQISKVENMLSTETKGSININNDNNYQYYITNEYLVIVLRKYTGLSLYSDREVKIPWVDIN